MDDARALAAQLVEMEDLGRSTLAGVAALRGDNAALLAGVTALQAEVAAMAADLATIKAVMDSLGGMAAAFGMGAPAP